MVLSWRDARTLIERAAATGELISDNVAQRIALTYVGTTSAEDVGNTVAADAPLVALALGDCRVDPDALCEQIEQLLAPPHQPTTHERTALAMLARWARSHASRADALLDVFAGVDADDRDVEFALEQCRTCGDHSDVVRIVRDETGRMIAHPGEWQEAHAAEFGREHAVFYLYTLTRNHGWSSVMPRPAG